MKRMKTVLLAGAALATLLLSGCQTYVESAYGPPYGGPYYGDWGPYDEGYLVGGARYHGHYGSHHFYGHSFGGHWHGGGGFRGGGGGGGFHGGGHGGGGHGGGGHGGGHR